jgi:filamentous hemagglutinin family protein
MALALVATFGSQGMALAATQIIPNGKTGTAVTTANGVTDVNTATIKNGVGVNAFSQFQVDQGNVVNLHVPDTANMLLNVVYDSPILINGIVNGVKDGALGGKIVFADPYGMVVGASGALNLGSLTVLTPTTGFLSGLIDGSGAVNDTAMNTLLGGTAPVSADGHITIKGAINALDAISLNGNLVDIGGKLTAGAAAAQKAAFVSAVNTTGLQAAQAITVQNGAIEIVAATIDVAQGASVMTGMNSGTVNIAATARDVQDGAADRSASAALAVDGTVEGHTVTLTATASAGSDNTGTGAASFRDAADGAGNALGFRWAEAKVGASASVTIGAGAYVHAADNVDIKAGSVQTNKLRVALGDNLNPGANSIAIHGTVDDGATVLVENGAMVDAGGHLVVAANNDSTLALQATVQSYTADMGVTLASGESHLATAATVQQGAHLIVGGGVDVVGRSTSNYSVQATSAMYDGGKAGIAAALGAMHETSDATLAADVTASGPVRVQADTIVGQNFSKAATTTGNSLVSSNVGPWILIGAHGMNDFTTTSTSLLVNAVDAAAKRANVAAGGQPDAGTTVKLGAAVSLADDSFGAHAAIGPNTTVKSTAGDVVVAARTEDHQIHNIAQSSVNSATSSGEGTAQNPAARFSGSAGVALAFLAHDAGAAIGDGARVEGEHIGVDSAVLLPLDITWDKWDGFSKIGTYLSPRLGVPETVLTSFANASGQATDGALAGSVNWFDAKNTSQAWVGRNAALTARAAPDAGYVAALAGDPGAQLALPASIVVHAENKVETADVAGNVNASILSGTGGGDGTTAVGASFGGVHYQNTTTAGVDAGATLTSDSGGLQVRAESDDKAFVVAPSTGGGSSISGNGALAYSHVDNETTAAISNRATVDVDSADVRANEALAIWTAAGGVARSSADSVGAGVAYNDVSASTRAMIGDVSGLPGAGGVGAAGGGAVTTRGHLDVNALTEGQAVALSVAGAKASSQTQEDADKDAAKAAKNNAKQQADNGTKVDPSTFSKAVASLRTVFGRASEAESAASPTPAAQPEIMFSAAGSSSVNDVGLATRATIDGSTVNAGSLALAAANNTNLTAASGAAASLSAGQPGVQQSAAVAGALAINLEHNVTAALATDLAYSGGDASIEALATGQHNAVGLGVAKNGEMDGTSVSGAGSASVLQSGNHTEAGAVRGTFGVNGAGSVKVLAYEHTDQNAGGVAAAQGGNAGVGVTVTYADVANTVDAHLDGAAVTGAADVTVAAVQAARIVAAGLQGTSTSGDAALGGTTVLAHVANTTSATIDAAPGAGGVHAGSVKVVASDNAGKEGVAQLVTDGQAAFGLASHGGGLFDFDATVGGVSLENSSGILNVAGAIDGGKSAVGAAVGYNAIANTTTAQAAGTIEADSVTVRASDNAVIASLAAGVAVATQSALAGVGSVSANTIANTTSATLGDADVTTVSAGRTGSVAVTVGAESASTVMAGAGSLAAGRGNSVGAAAAYNSNASQTGADVARSVIDGGGEVKVTAQQATSIKSLAAAVAASTQQTALAGSYTQNDVADATHARWSQSDLNRGSDASAATLAIKAADTAAIDSLAGSGALASGGSGAAGGAALALNRIGNQVDAGLLGGDVDGAASTVRAIAVMVNAQSADTTRSIAVALAASSGTGVGGSSATTISGSATAARIDEGANVVASDNVGVIAADANSVATFAGAAGIGIDKAGVGASTAINLLDDTTTARVGGNGQATHVTALGGDAGDTMHVAGGTLAGDVSLLSELNSAATVSATAPVETTRDVTGLAVNASNVATVGSSAVSAGVGKNGLAGTYSTTQIGGTTRAEISGALVNQDGAAGAGSDVDVRASSHASSANITGSIGVGAAVAVGLAADTQFVSGETTARVADSTVDAADLAVDARHSTTIAALGAGVAAGGNGGAGTGLVVQLGGATTAALAGGTTKADNVAVKAGSAETATLIGGALAGASGTGLGGVFGVIDAHQSTLATIGDAADPNATRVSARGTVSVDAASTVNNHVYAASAGLGGVGGVGLSVGVILDENDTTAQVAHVNGVPGQPALDAGGALSVTASEQDSSAQGIGALGIGAAGGGFGASVAVTEARAQVQARIADSSTRSAGLVLDAGNDQRIDSAAAAVAGGMYAGVGGAASVVQLGSGDGGTGTGDALSHVNGLLAAQRGGDTSGLDDGETAALGAGGRPLDATTMLAAGRRNGAGATVTGSSVATTGAGDVAIGAATTSHVANKAGTGALGAAAAGGAATVSAMHNGAEAGIDAASSVTAGGKLHVTAASGDGDAGGITSLAAAGAGGIVGLGAAVGIATIDNAVSAHAAGTLKAGGQLAVGAHDTSSIDAQADALAVGVGGAAGLTYVEAHKGGSVQAVLDGGTAPTIGVGADSAGAVKASALVGAAGIGLALGGNHADAGDSVDVGATLGGTVAADAATVKASRTPQVGARTTGAGVSGSVQVGVSTSDAEIGGSTTAAVADGTSFRSDAGLFGTGTLEVNAHNAVGADGTSATANATATGGGVLAGANGAEASARNTAGVAARIGDGVSLPLSDVLVAAQSDSVQRAGAAGRSAGAVSGGASVAKASSAVGVDATIGASSFLLRGALAISARGTDDNQGTASAGAGGVLAGSAAISSTNTDGSTNATLGAALVVAGGGLYLDSRHGTTFVASSDASQASVAGGSGADAHSGVGANVTAGVADGAKVVAGDIAIEASNNVLQAHVANNASGVSGGAVAGADISSTNTIATDTRATVGANATLIVNGKPLDNPGNLRIGAGTVFAGADSATVDGGAGVPVLAAHSTTDFSAKNTVDIGSGAVLSSVGDLDLGTWTMANVSNEADVHAYGLAGSAAGSAHSNITVTQKVDVGAGAHLTSWGNMEITSGRSPRADVTTSLTARATNEVYADGAVTHTDPEAGATVVNDSKVDIADGATLESVRDITLAAPAGVASADATGRGHYRVLGIPFTNSDASSSTGGTRSVVMDGSATAGTRHAISLYIDGAGNFTNADIACDLPNYDPVGQLTSQVTALKALKVGKDAATQSDIQGQIDALTGLIDTLQGRGLAQGNVVPAVKVRDTLAAGGNIDVDAGALSGHGTLDAWGGPTITLTNDSTKFLVVDKLMIPNELGGNIRYRGGATQGAFTATQHAPNAPASITISNNYDAGISSGVRAPAIFLTDSIENVGGGLSIFNKSGDLGQFGAVTVNNEQVAVPNGAYIVNTPAVPFFLNGDPQGQFVASDGKVFDLTDENRLPGKGGAALPGGANPLDSPSTMTSNRWGGGGDPGSPEEAVTYVANYIAKHSWDYKPGQPIAAYFANGLAQFADQMGNGGTGTMFFYIGSATADSCDDAGCGRSSPAYVARYGQDTGFYDTHSQGTFRYYYPAIADRALTNSVAVLAPAHPAPPSDGSTKIGDKAVINAKVIDINDTIRVGLPSDFNTTIDPQFVTTGVDAQGRPIQRDLIACINDAACRPAVAGLQSNGLYKYATTTAKDSTPIDVYYDPAKGQLVLHDVTGGGSGSISLRGQIVNTNAQGGNIEVRNGYAHVVVTNNTGIPLLTQDINTGDGNVGMVKITDTLRNDGAGNPLTTWYVNQLGSGMKIYQSYTAGDYAGLAPVATPSGRSSTYNPVDGERYFWRYDASLSRSFALTNPTDWNSAVVGAWTWDRLPPNQPSSLGNVWSISTGFVKDSALEGTQFFESIGGAITNSTAAEAVKYTDHGDWNWNWKIVTGVSISAYNSVKADFPIGVKFTSANTAGLVDINSNSGVTVGGTIQNTGGATVINATGANATIGATAKGVINTQSLDLTAQGGIGSVTAPLAVSLGNPGTDTGSNVVSATTTGGDIGLALSGADALIRNVNAGTGGDVLLTGSANLLNGGSGAAVVTGRNLTFASTGGTVGSAGQPLAINAQRGIDTAGLPVGGIVNASGNGVYLNQVAGDLYIGHVSSPGDVALTAAGNVLDGRNVASTSDDAARAALWDKMQLEKTDVRDAASAAVLAARVQAQYQAYQALVALGTVSGPESSPVFTLGDDGVKLLQGQADATVAGRAATPAEVRALAQSRFDALRSGLAEAGVVNGASFVPDPAKLAQLRAGQYWTTEELQYEINAAALNPVSSDVVAVTDAGVRGGNVTLGAGASIGAQGRPMHFDLDKGRLRDLDDAHKAALVSATAPGDLTLHFIKADGTACAVASATCTLTSFDIGQTRPLEVQVGQGLVARADNGNVYLAAQGTLPVASVAAGGDVRISSERGMLNVAAPSTAAITAGRDVVLLNGAGAIGSDDNFMTVSTGGAVALANSAGDLYLAAPYGDLAFDRLSAGNSLALRAQGDIRSVNVDGQGTPLPSVAAAHLWLDAGDSVYQSSGAGRGALLTQLYDGGAGTAGTVGGIVRGKLDLANDRTFTLDGLLVNGHANVVALSGDLQAGYVEGPDLALFAGAGKIVGAASAYGNGENIRSTGTVTLAGGSAAMGGLGTGIGRGANDRLIIAASTVDVGSAGGDAWIALADAGVGAATTVNASVRNGNTLDIASSTDFTAADLRAQDADIHLSTTGSAIATLARIDAGRDLYLDTIDGQFRTAAGGTVTVARDLHLTMTGNGTMDDGGASASGLVAGRDIVMNAAAMNISRLQAARNVDLTARSGDLRYGTLTASTGDVLLHAGGAVVGAGGGTLAAAGDAHVEGATLDLNKVATGNDAWLTVNGGTVGVNTDGSVVGRDLHIVSSGGNTLSNPQAGRLGVGRDVTIDAAAIDQLDVVAARNVTVNARSGDLVANRLEARTGSVLATANGMLVGAGEDGIRAALDVNLAADAIEAGRIEAGRNASVAGVTLDLGTVRVGGDAVLDAAAVMHASDLAIGGRLDARTGGSMWIDGATVGGPAVLAAIDMVLGRLDAGSLYVYSGDLAYTQLSASRDAMLEADGQLTGGTLRAGGNVSARAGTLAIGDVTAAGSASVTSTNGALTGSGTLQAAGVTVDAAGDARLHTVASNGDATVSAKGDLALDQLTAPGTVRLTADGNAAIGSIASGDTTVTAGGDATVGALASANAALTAGGNVGLTQADVRGKLVASGTTVNVGTANASGDATLTAVDSLQGRSLTTDGGLNAQAGGGMRIDAANVGGDATLTAADMTLGSIDAGGLSARSSGDLAYTQLTVHRDAMLEVDGHLTGGTLRAGANVGARAGTVVIGDITASGSANVTSTNGALTGSGTLQAGAVTVDAAGDARLHAVASSDDATVSAKGNLALDQLTAQGTVRVTADGSAAIGSIASGDAAVTAGGDANVGSLASANAALVAGGNLGLAQADVRGKLAASGRTVNVGTAKVSGTTTLTAADSLQVHSLTTDGGLNAQAGGGMRIDAAGVGGDAMLAAAGMTLGAIDAGGLSASSSGDLAYTQLTAHRDAAVSADGNLNGGVLQAGGNVGARAGTVDFGDITAGGNASVTSTNGAVTGSGTLRASSVSVDSAGDVRLHAVASNGDATVSAKGNLALDQLTAPGAVRVTADGNAAIGSIASGDATITAGGGVGLTQADVHGQIAASGSTVSVGTARVSGDTTLTAADSLQVQNLTTDRGLNAQAGGNMRIDAANVGGDATLAAAGMTLGVVDAGGLSASSSGDLAYTQLTAVRDATLEADGGLAGGTLRAGGNVSVRAGMLAIGDTTVGGNARMTSTSGALIGSGTLQASSVTVDAAGDARLHAVASNSDATVSAKGDLALDQLTAPGTVRLTADGNAAIGSIASGDTRITAGGNAAVAALTSGDATVAAGGAANVGSLASANTALTAGGNLGLTQADVRGKLAASGGTVAVGTAKVSGDTTLTAADSLQVQKLTTDRGLTAQAGGSMRIDAANVGGDATLAAAGMTLGVVDAGGLSARSSGDLAYTQLTAHRDAAVGADGHLNGGVLQAGGNVGARAGTLDFGDITASGNASVTSTNGAITGSGALQASSVTVDAAGDARLHAATSNGDATVSAKGDLALDQLTAPGTVRLTADGNAILGSLASGAATITAVGNATAASLTSGDATVTAGGDATVGSLASANAALTAGGSLGLTQADVHGQLAASGTTVNVGTAKVSGDTTLTAADSLQGQKLTTDRGLTAQAGGSMRIDAANVGGDATLAAAGMTLGVVDAGGLSARSSGDLAYTQLTAHRDAAVGADGHLNGGVLQAGGNVGARAGTLDFGDITASGNASVTSTNGAITGSGALQASSVTVDAAGDARLHAATSNGDATVSAKGDLALDQLTAPGTVRLTADGNAILGSLASGAATITAVGNATAASLTSGDATVTAGGDATVGSLASANAALTAGGSLGLTQADVRGKLAASGTTVNVGTAKVSGDTTLTAAGSLQAHSLTTDGGLNAQAGGSIRIDAAGVGGDTTLAAAGMALGAVDTHGVLAARAGEIAFGDLTAGASAHLSAATGDISGTGLLRAAGVTVEAGHDAIVARVASSGDAAVRAGGRIDVAGLASDGPALVEAGTDAHVGTLTVGAAGRAADLSLRAGGLASADSGDVWGSLDTASAQLELGTLRVHGNAQMDTSGSMQAASLSVGGNVKAGAEAAMHLAAVDAGGTVTLRAADMTVDALRASGDVDLAAGGTLRMGGVRSGRDVSATAGVVSADAAGVLAAARDVRVEAREVQAGTVQAGRDATLTSAGGLSGGAFSAANDLSLGAGGTIAAASLSAGRTLGLDGRQGVDVGTMWAATMAASTPGVLRIRDLALQQSAVLSAARIDAGLRQAGSQGLTLTASGYQGGVADTVDLRIDAPAGVAISGLRAGTASVTSTAHDNRIDRGFVTGTLQLRTPDGVMMMNNRSAGAVSGASIQLFAPDYAFALGQQGSQYLTDAYVIQYSGAARPTVPNYQDSHVGSTIMVYGASAARDQERDASANRTPVQPVLAAAPVASAPAPFVARPDGLAVNLGGDEGAPREQDVIFETTVETN